MPPPSVEYLRCIHAAGPMALTPAGCRSGAARLMIFGIGTDICDHPPHRATLARRGDRFAEKVLGPSELAGVQRPPRTRLAARGLAYLATRFSAKESFSKAIGLGLRMPMTWRACEILNHPSGQPYIRCTAQLADWCQARRLTAHVTLSDETDYVVSFVVVERTQSVARACQRP